MTKLIVGFLAVLLLPIGANAQEINPIQTSIINRLIAIVIELNERIESLEDEIAKLKSEPAQAPSKTNTKVKEELDQKLADRAVLQAQSDNMDCNKVKASYVEICLANKEKISQKIRELDLQIYALRLAQ